MTDKPRLKIVTCTHNGTDYLRQCLRSLEMQTFRGFDVCIVDDASTNPGHRELIDDCVQRNDWLAVFKEEQRGGLHSFIQGVQALDPDDEDVICVLDGDDWLAQERSLEIVHQAYQDPEVWVTYGSLETLPPGQVDQQFLKEKVPESVFEEGKLRLAPYVFLHMQTFKAFLWKQVEDEDLRAPDGDYFRVCGDRARFYPVLEMGRGHIHRIDQIIYTYNMSNPQSHFRQRPEMQKAMLEAVQAITPYPPYRR